MGKKNKGKAGTVIWKVRDIHIHLDEHMETTNHFGEDSCGCQCGDCEGLEIDMEELAGKIAEKSGVDAGTVKKVLAAEEHILAQMGVVEIEEDDAEALADAETEDTAPGVSAESENASQRDKDTAQETGTGHKPEGSPVEFLEKELPEMIGQLLGGAVLMGIMESVDRKSVV